jgi:hypothetical protein
MAKQGTVVINKATGEFSIDLTGYKGKGCTVDAAQFTRGGKVTKDVKKPEYKLEQKTVTQQMGNA